MRKNPNFILVYNALVIAGPLRRRGVGATGEVRHAS